MEDRIYRTRSLGVAAAGIPDQYADGRAARVWELYMGSRAERTAAYKDWLLATMAKWNVSSLADVACGTGVDSIMLVENGFKVVSCDASDKMLKYALEERWRRRKDPLFDAWIIKEANWLSLKQDMESISDKPEAGFDAVICMGNSFAHLPDFDGEQLNHRVAFENFFSVLRPGGILLIDHRNYDYILSAGMCPQGKNIYYPSSHIKDITCSNLFVNGKPWMVTLDYVMDISSVNEKTLKELRIDPEEKGEWKFRLSYYPHRLDAFSKLLESVFGQTAHHELYGDFKPVEQNPTPCYYIHVIQKPFN